MASLLWSLIPVMLAHELGRRMGRIEAMNEVIEELRVNLQDVRRAAISTEAKLDPYLKGLRIDLQDVRQAAISTETKLDQYLKAKMP